MLQGCSKVASRSLTGGALLLAVMSVRAENIPKTLDSITVTGKNIPQYRARSAAVGPLGERPLLDTPYSLQVVTQDLFQNQQFKSVRDAFRYLPSAQGDNIRPQTRGLQAGVVHNTRIDGMNIAATTDYPIEQFERIEVLNGLAGALYGPASPAGTFNHVLKRPTMTRLRTVSVGHASRGQYSIGADFSDRFRERFGYRLNLLDEGGDGYSKGSSLDRRLFSAAFDIGLGANTRLETNFSRYHYTSKGLPGNFVLASQDIVFSRAPDPARAGYGQPFAGDNNVTKTTSGRIVHHFNPDWSFNAGLLRQTSDRESSVPTNRMINNQGDFTVSVFNTTFTLDEVLSYTAALNGQLETGHVQHDLVISSTGFNWERSRPYQTAPVLLGNSNLDAPVIFDAPPFPAFKNRYRSQTTRQRAFTIGDTISLHRQWSAGVFLNHSQITQSGRTANGAAVERLYYDADGISKNITLTYKPQDSMSLYGSYADSLQQGEASDDTILPPYRSKQWELGYKADIAGLGFSAALFRIKRPFAWAENGVFAVRGEQVNRGVEIMLNGSPTRNLSLFGGVSYLDPKLHDTANPATNNKQIMGLPNWRANTVLDYQVENIPGLAFNLNIGYMGKRQGNHINSYKVPAHTVVDIGVRHAGQAGKYPIIWRLTLNNVTDKHYWANITPSGQNGYLGSGAGNSTLGMPRMLRASIQMEF